METIASVVDHEVLHNIPYVTLRLVPMQSGLDSAPHIYRHFLGNDNQTALIFLPLDI